MSISQPSKLVYVIEVPKVRNFTAEFKYNFFTPDEIINDTGGVPAEALARPASNIDADFIQWSLTRVPREVDFSFSLPKIAEIGNVVSELQQRNNKHKNTGTQYGSLIQDNIDKIIDEDYFSLNGFVAVSFHDGQIDDKIHSLVSGTLTMSTLEDEHQSNTSHYRASQRLVAVLPKRIQPHFVFRGMSMPHRAYGGRFYPLRIKGRVRSPTRHPKSPPIRFIDHYFDRLKKVAIHGQVNSKLFQDLVQKTISDPTSVHAADVATMHSFAKQAKQATNHRFSPAVAEQDYKTFVPFISVKKQGTAAHHDKYSAEVVGFIIDKFEQLPDGTTKKLEPIVIETPHAALSADFKIKFNSTYCYSIRTIAQLTLPAIDDSNFDVATVKVLVSSKPSHKIYVPTSKFDAPPPPGDIDFVLNYETNKLLVTWAFPVWSQRDVKKFQIFRRKNINHPFELQKEYNFDDSVAQAKLIFNDNERPDPTLVEVLAAPCQFYIDDEFDVTVNTSKEKSFIYAVSCIDAHGLSSALSAQYRVWYDPFKNKLLSEHVSHLGAPKCYPNLYLDGDIFTNTIKVSGPSSKSMKLYFNPEYYVVYDDNERTDHVVATQQKGGSYKLQFINMDNGKAHDIDIFIDDQLSVDQRTLATPQYVFGPRRVNTVLERRPL
jgi:hypothetical protein